MADLPRTNWPRRGPRNEAAWQLYTQGRAICQANNVTEMSAFFNNNPRVPMEDYINLVQSVEMLQVFTRRGYSARERDEDGKSLLLRLCDSNRWGMTPKKKAAELAMMEHLLSVDPTLINEAQGGWTCLHFCARSFNDDGMELLLRHNPPLNAQQATNYFKGSFRPGSTALHIAARGEYNKEEECKRMIRMLIDAGIDTTIKCHDMYLGDLTAAQFGSVDYTNSAGRKNPYGLGEYITEYLYRPPNTPGDPSTAGPMYRQARQSASNKGVSLLNQTANTGAAQAEERLEGGGSRPNGGSKRKSRRKRKAKRRSKKRY